MEALLTKKSLHMEKSRGRKSMVKKKKKPCLERKERVQFCQEMKKFLCESNWYWESSMLVSRLILNKEVAVKLKFAIHNAKNEVSFSLHKYQP